MRPMHARSVTIALAFAAASCGSTTPRGDEPRATPARPEADRDGATDRLAEQYGEVARTIIERAKAHRSAAWAKLEELTVHIGPRLSGSASLDRALAWAADTMKKEGQQNVRVEKVMVPHWVRGPESAALVVPRRQKLHIIGLGGTVATPPGGLRAPVMVVKSKEELEARAGEARGKIVLYNAPMAPWDRDEGDGYDEVYEYRNSGSDWASKHGAVATLVRSLTTRSLATPHTGGLHYGGEVERIPAAAITVEEAEMIAKLAARGPVEVELELSGKMLEDAESGNVIAELRGRESPEEIVLIGAHIDSWDNTPGAQDDGGGCVIMMEALSVLRDLGLEPRRTIRVVLFTNEENGLRGAEGYAKAHAAEIPDHVVAMESDGGVFAPRGFLVEKGRGIETTRRIARLLAPIGADEVKEGFGGADVGPLVEKGVPGIGHWVEDEHYFDVHHTAADSMDKIDPDDLAANVAAVAVFAYVAADMPRRFGDE